MPSTQPGDGMTAEEAGILIAQKRAERAQAPQPGENESAINTGKPAEIAAFEDELVGKAEVRKSEPRTDPEDELEEVIAEEAEPEQEASEDESPEEVVEDDDEAQEDAETQADSIQFETVEDFASALDLSVDDFMDQIKITTKVDGVTEEVPLAQLRKGYQLEQTANRRLQQIAEQQKQFGEEMEQAKAQTGQQFQTAGLVFQAAEQQLLSDFQAVDWATLERDEPDRYTAMRQKFGERKAQLDQIVSQATVKAQEAMEAQKQAKEKAKQENFEKQAQLLVEKLPNFGKGADGKAQVEKVAQVLDSVGYSSDELNNIEDHRLVLLANMAIKGQDNTSRQEILKKKLKTLPPVSKPGARNRKPLTEQKKTERNLRAKLKKSGSVDDVAELLLARRGVRR